MPLCLGTMKYSSYLKTGSPSHPFNWFMIHHHNLCQVLFIAIVCLAVSWFVQKSYQQIVMKCPIVQCYDPKNMWQIWQKGSGLEWFSGLFVFVFVFICLGQCFECFYPENQVWPCQMMCKALFSGFVCLADVEMMKSPNPLPGHKVWVTN